MPTITIEKEWDSNVRERERNGRIYVSHGRWQWLVIVDGEIDSEHDRKRDAVARMEHLMAPTRLNKWRESRVARPPGAGSGS